MLKDIQNLPNLPGVYLMLNKQGSVIYVGKAKDLRKRVKSYFNSAGDSRVLNKFLLPRVKKVDYLVTDTEKEALILENNLIKKYKPRYNIDLKDDKTHLSLKFTIRDKFPKLLLVRKIKKDGSQYFGPYSSSQAVKDTLKSIHYLFPLRTCRDTNFKNRTRPCLNYQIGRCLAPCAGKLKEEEYRKYVNGVTLFLKGRNNELLRFLKKMMKQESEQLKFEEAARIRDRISSIEKTVEKQKIVSHATVDQDIFGIYRQGDVAGAALLFIREGRLLDSKTFYFSSLTQTDGEILSSFLHQFYGNEVFIPREVIIPLDIEDKEATDEWLREKKGGKVSVLVPKRGGKLSLVKMAETNARHYFKVRQERHICNLEILEEIKKRLGLRKLPLRIACADISNFKGDMATGSVVSFFEGEPNKERYRHFRINTIAGMDDYGMMHELLSRYTSKLTPDTLPQLLIIDGGKGHLNVALSVLKNQKIEEIDVVALAKGEKEGKILRNRQKIREDRFFLPGRKNPLLFPNNSPAFFLLQRIRDESHRFAINYHKKLLSRKSFKSRLDDIAGIGPIKKKELIRHFGSVRKIRNASIEEIAKVPKVSRKDVKMINIFFQKKE